MRPRIVVVGSTNVDISIRTTHIPLAGETVLGESYLQSNGGKGANQAIAAARLGADVTFVTRLGKDRFGKEAFDAFEKEGVNTKYISWDERLPTGVAMIMVDSTSENIICVVPGANANLSTKDVLRAEEAIMSADYLLIQLEVPMETVEFAINLASKHAVRVVFNPAPMTKLSKEILEKVNVITTNETEAAALTGNFVPDTKVQASIIKEKLGIKNVIVTLGKDGVIVFGENSLSPIQLPSFPIDAVDTTGAGDAFNGALTVALARGERLEEAVRYANAVGALATTREGAQSSLPTAIQVETFLRNIENSK